MLKFVNTEKSIKIDEIERLESLTGLTFPIEYKNHLLKYNGGQCVPNTFQFKENGKLTNSCIDWFLAVYDGDSDNLEEYINIVKIEEKRMPTHILPIAHDPLGNLICISCKNRDYGQIYFWNHEDEVDYEMTTDDDYANLYLLAKDFNSFLEGLK